MSRLNNFFTVVRRRIIAQHVIRKTIVDTVIDPSHAQRTETPEFAASKARLIRDGHHQCFICMTTDALQVHHFGCEWMFWDAVDPEKVKAFCETFDPYGYGAAMKNVPMTSPDDIRNCLTLCETHHIGKHFGIHELTFPSWISQKLAKSGVDTIPHEPH